MLLDKIIATPGDRLAALLEEFGIAKTSKYSALDHNWKTRESILAGLPDMVREDPDEFSWKNLRTALKLLCNWVARCDARKILPFFEVANTNAFSGENFRELLNIPDPETLPSPWNSHLYYACWRIEYAAPFFLRANPTVFTAEMLGEFLTLLESPCPMVRWAGLQAVPRFLFADRSHTSRALHDRLCRVLSDDNWKVRGAALLALMAVYHHDPSLPLPGDLPDMVAKRELLRENLHQNYLLALPALIHPDGTRIYPDADRHLRLTLREHRSYFTRYEAPELAQLWTIKKLIPLSPALATSNVLLNFLDIRMHRVDVGGVTTPNPWIKLVLEANPLALTDELIQMAQEMSQCRQTVIYYLGGAIAMESFQMLQPDRFKSP